MIITFNNKIIAPDGKWLSNYLPPIPEYSIRIRYKEGFVPSGNVILRDHDLNVWDKYGGTRWQYIASDSQFGEDNILEIIGANSSGVTEMPNAFEWGSFTSVPLFDTSAVTNWGEAFWGCNDIVSLPLYDTHSIESWYATFKACTSLTYIPDFDLSSATNFQSTFQDCWKVEGGILRMYNKLVALGEQVSHNENTFHACGLMPGGGGYASEQARLERAQIPTTWGGDMQV